jgi:hypothetical protein
MVVVGAVKAPVPCLLGEGRSTLPSSSKAMGNPSVESLIMAHVGNGGPLQVEPMTAATILSPMGERLRPLNRSAMNSRLLKQMVSPREKTSLTSVHCQ